MFYLEREIKKFIKKIKLGNYLHDNNKLDIKEFEQSMASFKGSLGHADCYKFINKCYSKIKFIET